MQTLVSDQKRIFKTFEQVDPSESFVGGKAFVLSQLVKMNLPVPPGAVLTHLPNDQTWQDILKWWEENDMEPLAVRSSGCGEDSDELSYAGQQQTFLNVKTHSALVEAVSTCFHSDSRQASRSYREHFGQADQLKMNVILQVMIDPLFAGVYFTADPRTTELEKKGWLIEMTDGLGEKLVSGQVNPYRISEFEEKIPPGWTEKMTQSILQGGVAAEKYLQKPADMEWAIDKKNRFWVLQARPITTHLTHRQRDFDTELSRLRSKYSDDTVWDGQTFSDWASAPSELTFDLWQKAFSTEGAFSKALIELGYLGKINSAEGSILERVFGRPYLNLHQLEPLYFGEIPYRIEAKPRPHLKFDPAKITAKMIINTPRPLMRMLKVAWRLKTHRNDLIEIASKNHDLFLQELNSQSHLFDIKQFSNADIFELWRTEISKFHSHSMKWPFVLTFLIESTMQSLQILLQKVEPPEKARLKLQKWMSSGIHTITSEMARSLNQAIIHPEQRIDFLKSFGHRGPREMDLAHPRWIERNPFTERCSVANIKKVEPVQVENEISAYGLMKGSVISQEWVILKKLLELREEWKNQIMRSYLEIRLLTLELARRLAIEKDVFWMTVSEIEQLSNHPQNRTDIIVQAQRRRQENENLSKVALPLVVSLREIEKHGNATDSDHKTLFKGESLSAGLAYGTAVVLNSPDDIQTEELPEDMILFTETIDPGWTAIFRRAKAIATEHGGVLSHAAIIAREMGIPAVSQLPGIRNQITTGTKVWIDGTHGVVTLEDKNGPTYN